MWFSGVRSKTMDQLAESDNNIFRFHANLSIAKLFVNVAIFFASLFLILSHFNFIFAPCNDLI